ncbi:hypothetical protein RRG08_058153 [Elysia crispata]|uniref:Uncharacterized protein n=1 Tax=Elysia crispata TaxID=231223 RepID=A0AAE1CRM1_9GAST|nr:hypothetical protein RRG08_058153 [Elysia crispata]
MHFMLEAKSKICRQRPKGRNSDREIDVIQVDVEKLQLISLCLRRDTRVETWTLGKYTTNQDEGHRAHDPRPVGTVFGRSPRSRNRRCRF